MNGTKDIHPLEYAAPKPMSHKRLAVIVASTGATIVIGGATYLMAQTTQPIIRGDTACPVVSIDPASPATQPARPPVTPGKPLSVPATQPVAPVMPGAPVVVPATQPVEK